MEAQALGPADLAELAEVTETEIGRLVSLGILVPREGPAPFRTTDMQKVRLATACERAGLPMDAIAEVIRAGRLSFAFMEAAPYHRFALPSTRTFRQVSQDTGIPLETLQETLESHGRGSLDPQAVIKAVCLATSASPPGPRSPSPPTRRRRRRR